MEREEQAALDFLKHVAEPFQDLHGSGIVFRLPADVAAAVQYSPIVLSNAHRRARLSSPCSQQPRGPMRVRTRRCSLRSPEILGSLDQVHALVAARTRSRPHLTNEFIAPRTPAEKSVAAILAQVLGIDRVGVEDSFFDLGGHSLLAVQVLSRIKEEFHVELSTRLLYHSSFTAADLAARVQTLQLERANPVQIATLLERLNALSDDEVVALLARETEATGQPNNRTNAPHADPARSAASLFPRVYRRDQVIPDLAALESLSERNHACRIVSLATSDEGPETRFRSSGTRWQTREPRCFAHCPTPTCTPTEASRFTWLQTAPVCGRIWRSKSTNSTRAASSSHRIGPSLALPQHWPRPEPLASSFWRTASDAPIGPECFSPDEAKTDILRRTGHVGAESLHC